MLADADAIRRLIQLLGRQERQFVPPSDDVEDDRCFSHLTASASDLYKDTFTKLLRKREYGITHNFINQAGIHMIPNNHMIVADNFHDRVYNGRFSPDGNFYCCGSQSDVVIFDTTDPYDWQHLKSEDGVGIQWTVTDIDFTPCQRYILYSTIDSHISLINLKNEVDFDNEYKLRYNGNSVHETIQIGNQDTSFGIWSFKISGDGREVICATSQETLEVFDLVNRQNVSTVVNAHNNDINTVCFANRENSHIVFSGSDDASIKVWDRRTFGGHSAAQGVLIGHREGVSCVSSKGDGIQLISNSKDQTMKLWDLRKMSTLQEYRDFTRTHHVGQSFDYRWEDYPNINYTKRLAADTSQLTFRNHRVLKTLIRCYFSPAFSTGQRFVYTGSADGRVVIYDTLTGKLVKSLCTEDRSTIRDVNWHPTLPIIAYTSFNCDVGMFLYGD